VESLAVEPRPPGCVKLTGTDDLYRLRVGAYRVVYALDDGDRLVVITRVARRAENTYSDR
jgi:mRNA interferase RelE/StbE